MKKILPILFVTVLIASCYTFKGISIDYTKVSTFSLGDFPNNSTNVVPTLSQDFREAMRLKVLSQSRLGSATANGDVEFNGSITGYQITSVAPQPGETTQFNRLTITVQVDFVNNTNPEQNWSQSFNWFADYGANENLPNVQDALHETIITELVENIFNKAFTNW
ncbi:MAG: hypothetical protein HC803_12065 [Saprospiraceae bacterium]|nr:hypothetical protein [Saprospiraceae bacterium]